MATQAYAHRGAPWLYVRGGDISYQITEVVDVNDPTRDAFRRLLRGDFGKYYWIVNRRAYCC